LDSRAKTYFDVHGAALRESVQARLAARGDDDPVLLVIREYLHIDPISGERRDLVSPRTDLARYYHQFLLDNERLPQASQLTLDEVRLVWEALLSCYGDGGGGEGSREQLSTLFRLVERKMEQGRIRQAWALLNIFEYERHVQVDNERSLFLEEMARRFARYSRDALRPVSEELRSALRTASEDLGALPVAVTLLREELGINLLHLQQDRAEQTAWDALWNASGLGGSEPEEPEGEALTPPAFFSPDILFVRKWRRPCGLADLGTDPLLLSDLLHPECVRHYCATLLQDLYFLMLITESTGHEAFLSTFMVWLRGVAGPASMGAFSRLHGRLNLSERTTAEALDELLQDPVLARLPDAVRSLEGEALRAALQGLLAATAEGELGAVAAGDYNLAGLLFDRAMGLTYPKMELGWRLHRII